MGYQTIINRWHTWSFRLKCLVSSCALGIVLLTFFLAMLPNVNELKTIRMQVPLQVFSKDHKLIATFGEKKRFPVNIGEMPILMQKAFIAAEDQRFYQHHGVDIFGLLRATGALIAKGGHITQGASTITMQVARNFYLSRHKTFARKFNEILLAWKIEHALNKAKILELYLNKIYLGTGAYGIAAASQIYYGKPLHKLSLAEMAMLAGLPKAPSANNPLRNPERALKRRNYVLRRMLDLSFIDQEQFDQASQAGISAQFHGPNIQLHAPYIAEMARQALVAQFKEDAYTQGYKVFTTINSKLQAYANRATHNGLIAYSERHGYIGSSGHINTPEAWPAFAKNMRKVRGFHKAFIQMIDDKNAYALLADNTSVVTIPWSAMKWASPRLKNGYRGKAPKATADILQIGDVVYLRKMGKTWHLTQIPQAQTAMVSLDANNGHILALVGGFEYSLSNYNRVLQAKRQAGSAFKPFIYAAALANHMTLADIINDAPLVIEDISSTDSWRPHNSSEQFHGPTRLREGLIKSRNLVSIRLLQKIGIEKTIDFLKRFQFSPEGYPQSLSLALGSGVSTPLEITRAYAAFANGGFLVSPSFIHEIQDDKHRIIYRGFPQEVCKTCKQKAPRIMNADLAYLIHNTLQDVIQHGTGRKAKSLGRSDLAGKTGTTNDKIDAWFAGFNRDIVTTVWIGYDKPKPLHEYGAQAALPVWIDFMGKALYKRPNHTLARPGNVVTMRIDPNTGLPPTSQSSQTLFEIFRQDSLPLRHHD